jgi:hypothetical protein
MELGVYLLPEADEQNVLNLIKDLPDILVLQDEQPFLVSSKKRTVYDLRFKISQIPGVRNVSWIS